MHIRVLAGLTAAVTVLGAAGATAASLSAAFPGTAAFGSTVTLSLSGDSEGAAVDGVFVQLATSHGTFVNPQLNPLDGGDDLDWVGNEPPSCEPQLCTLANAFSIGPVDEGFHDWGTVDLDLTGLPVGTVVDLTFTGDPSLSWYDLTTDQPAGTITIVPEPATAALLGLGLLGLGLRGRRSG